MKLFYRFLLPTAISIFPIDTQSCFISRFWKGGSLWSSKDGTATSPIHMGYQSLSYVYPCNITLTTTTLKQIDPKETYNLILYDNRWCLKLKVEI